MPTLKELGHAFSIDSPVGLVAPKGLDPKIATRLQDAFQKASTDPTYQQQLALFDMVSGFTTGEAYAAYARAQFDRDQKMLAEIGFKLD